MPGLLDMLGDPRQMGLLGLAQGLLQGSARSYDPRHGSFGYAMGQGLRGGTQGLLFGQAMREQKTADEKRKAAQALQEAHQRGASAEELRSLYWAYDPVDAVKRTMQNQRSPYSVQQGTETVTYQPGRGGEPAVEIGRGPKWNPRTGGATAPQQANNAEIDQDRAVLAQIEQELPPGTTLAEEIQRRIGRADPVTGRMIPDYNSFLGRAAWNATQRKVGGDDPDQATWRRKLLGFAPAAGAMPKSW